MVNGTGDASATALLVMDLEAEVVDRYGEHSAPVIASASRAIAAARAAGILVVFVVVCFRRGHPEVADSNRMFASIREAGWLVEDGPGTAVLPALGVRAGDVVVRKRRVSAFAGSDLDTVLRAHRTTDLVLCGIATSGVVLSTLRLAADLDYRLTVLADACADGDPEVHRVLTEKVFPRQATVVTTDDWVGSLAARPDLGVRRRRLDGGAGGALSGRGRRAPRR